MLLIDAKYHSGDSLRAEVFAPMLLFPDRRSQSSTAANHVSTPPTSIHYPFGRHMVASLYLCDRFVDQASNDIT